MTEDQNRAQLARDAFARILARFLALGPEDENGSITVHYVGRIVRKVEWRSVDSVDRWERKTG